MEQKQHRLMLYCYYCNFSSKSKEFLRRHVIKCMENVMFGCNNADYSLQRQKENMEQKQHRLMLYCYYCNFSSKSKEFLRRHVIKCMENVMFGCNNADYSLQRKKENMEQEQLHPTLYCYYCNFSAKSKSFLRQHVVKCMESILLGYYNSDSSLTFMQHSSQQIKGVQSDGWVVEDVKTLPKKTVTKKHNCLYCNKFVTKIERHFQRLHRNEMEVVQFLRMEKRSKERHEVMQRLKKKGDYYHNLKAIETKESYLILARQRTTVVEESNYTPCTNCLGFFNKKSLWRHMKICNKNIEFGRKSSLGENKTLLVETYKRSKRRLLSSHESSSEKIISSGSVKGYHEKKRSLFSNDSSVENTSCVQSDGWDVEDVKTLPKKTVTKKHNCLYCNKFVTKIERHFEKSHQDEMEVVQFLRMEKRSKERHEVIQRLKKKGDYYHNLKAIETKESGLVLARQRTMVVEESNYTPCANCLGFFYKNSLRRHMKNCKKNIDFGQKSPLDESVQSDGGDEEDVKTLPKKTVTKKHNCIYCHKFVTKIERHFQRLHRNETEVLQFLSMKKGSKERHEVIQSLKMKGNFYHNLKAIEKKGSGLVLARQQASVVEESNYTPCTNCLGFYNKKSLWRHMKNCNKNIKVGRKSSLGESRALLIGGLSPTLDNKFVESILSHMKDDEISNTAKSDGLISRFGIVLYNKYGNEKTEYVRQKMREMSRLLILLKDKLGSSSEFADCLTPANFDLILDNIKILCGGQQENGMLTFDKPSLALKIGHSLKTCAALLQGEALKTDETSRRRSIQDFITLIDNEYKTKISSPALLTLNKEKSKCFGTSAINRGRFKTK